MNAPARAHTSPAAAPWRRTLVLGVLALCAAALPAAAQQENPAPAADSAAVGSASGAAPAAAATGRETMRRLREGVRSAVASPLPEFRYARRLGVAPDLARTIEEMARAEGVDPELAFRIIRVESRFNPRAISSQGARGLMQVMPGTARSVERGVTNAQLLDARTNLRIGLRYLRTLLHMFDGDVRLAVLAYNRGEGNVMRALRAGRDPENGYSHHVLGTRGATPYRGPGLMQKAPNTAPARAARDR